MATRIVEFHGAPPLTTASRTEAKNKSCPFVGGICKKKKSGGACVLAPIGGEPVIICPNRLYANNFEVIRRVAHDCFGDSAELITEDHAEIRRRAGTLSGYEVVVYGQGFSGEIGIQAPSDQNETSGSYKIDFILVKIDQNLEPVSFVAIEVQTIDTTDSYADVSKAFYSAGPESDVSADFETKAGFNWENVSKRILPQIIYKGHALRREFKAQFGLYFILPRPVYDKIWARIGGRLLEYPRGMGTITFHPYEIGPMVINGPRELVLGQAFTTTVEQIAFAFVSPQNLPPLGVYEAALTAKLRKLATRRKLKQSEESLLNADYSNETEADSDEELD